MRYTIIVYFVAFLLCLTGLLLPGCAQHYQVDPELQPYIDSFIQADPQHRPITNLVAKFGVTSTEEYIGQCTTMPDNVTTPTIVIEQEVWPQLDEPEKTALVWHELGHCILFRKHEFTNDPDGCPTSIMYPSLAVPGCDAPHWQEWVTDLFAY